MLSLAEDAGLNHGYLENQVFCTPVLRGKEIIWRRAATTTGRPYLARAAENIPARTNPGSGRATSRAAACFRT